MMSDGSSADDINHNEQVPPNAYQQKRLANIRRNEAVLAEIMAGCPLPAGAYGPYHAEDGEDDENDENDEALDDVPDSKAACGKSAAALSIAPPLPDAPPDGSPTHHRDPRDWRSFNHNEQAPPNAYERKRLANIRRNEAVFGEMMARLGWAGRGGCVL